MNILQVTYTYPPTGEIGDGITKEVKSISLELTRLGHKVTVLTSDSICYRVN